MANLTSLMSNAYERKRNALGLHGSFFGQRRAGMHLQPDVIVFTTPTGDFAFYGGTPTSNCCLGGGGCDDFDAFKPVMFVFKAMDELTKLKVGRETVSLERSTPYTYHRQHRQHVAVEGQLTTYADYNPAGKLRTLQISPTSGIDVKYAVRGETARRRGLWLSDLLSPKHSKLLSYIVPQYAMTKDLAAQDCASPKTIQLEDLAAGRVRVTAHNREYAVPAVPARIDPESFTRQALAPLLVAAVA